MEAVSPDLLFGQIFEGQSICEGVGRHCVMERGIENGDLFRVRKMAAGRADGFQIVWVVQGRKSAQRVDLFLNGCRR